MKKIFSVLALLLLTCSAVHAQYMLKVKYTDGHHDLYQVDCTDVWLDRTTPGAMAILSVWRLVNM